MAGIFEHMKKSWRAYKKNFVPLVFSGIIASVALWLLSAAMLISVFGISPDEKADFIRGTYFSEPNSPYEDLSVQEHFLEDVGSGWIFLFLAMLFFVSTYMASGLYGVAISSLKGKSGLNDFFRAIRERGLSLVAANVLWFAVVFAATFVTFVIIITAGLIVAALYTVSPVFAVVFFVSVLLIMVIALLGLLPAYIVISPAVVLGKGIKNPIKEVLFVTRKHYFSLLSLFAVYVAISLFGYLLMLRNTVAYSLLAVLFISPYTILLVCSVYIDKSSKSRARSGAQAASGTVPRKAPVVSKPAEKKPPTRKAAREQVKYKLDKKAIAKNTAASPRKRAIKIKRGNKR
ncbi:MAG: hypothetical protein ACP5E4_01345 [Candidatus Aenigmatarchaeota archaeon]